MNVTYSDKAKQGGEEYTLLQHATKQLEELLGEAIEGAAEGVKAEWDRGQDAGGRTTYTLRLSDEADSVSSDFSPDELQSDKDLQRRLRRLWSSLLAARGRRILRGLRESRE
ncbi:MAG TPA: hypothetical protein VKA46_00110 [Gemmataceae bacterium]|nr:hypothetical protein [Gemmataceae bacterium]